MQYPQLTVTLVPNWYVLLRVLCSTGVNLQLEINITSVHSGTCKFLPLEMTGEIYPWWTFPVLKRLSLQASVTYIDTSLKPVNSNACESNYMAAGLLVAGIPEPATVICASSDLLVRNAKWMTLKPPPHTHTVQCSIVQGRRLSWGFCRCTVGYKARHTR